MAPRGHLPNRKTEKGIEEEEVAAGGDDKVGERPSEKGEDPAGAMTPMRSASAAGRNPLAQGGLPASLPQ